MPIDYKSIGLWAALALLVPQSCSNLRDTIIVSEVEKEFYIDIYEALQPSLSQLVFDIRTVDNEDCLNYTVETNFRWAGNRMLLSVEGIKMPDDCQVGEGPARTNVNAGYLGGLVYELDIDLQGTVFSKARLYVLPDLYRLEVQSENGIVFLRKLLRKVPPQAIWGYCTYTDPDLEPTAQATVATLMNPCGTHNMPIGYYGQFSILENGVEVRHKEASSQKLVHFVYECAGDRSEAAALVAQLRSTLPEGMTLRCWTGMGEEW